MHDRRINLDYLTKPNMRTIPIRAISLALLGAAVSILGMAQPPAPGGYAEASITDQQVVAAANFAVKAQGKVIREEKAEKPPTLELLTIEKAEQQVVAGMNYRLKLKVKLDGKERSAEAIVWWQAWRKPEPYTLTGWTWN